MSDDQIVREQVLNLLRSSEAHINFENLLADFPVAGYNEKIEGVPYTAWQLLEHMRLAQRDILRFSVDADHVSPEFPKGYWPAPDAVAGVPQWNRTVEAFRADLKEMETLVSDQTTDLYARIPHGDGQTILREALLVADHNAYHLGVLTVMKRILNGKGK